MLWRNPSFDFSKIDPPLRPDYWKGIYTPIRCMVDYRIAIDERACVTGYRGVQFRDVDVFRYEGRGLHKGDRLSQHIRQDNIDDYLLSLPLTACIEFGQDGRSFKSGPDHFVLLSTARPFTASVGSINGYDRFSALHIRLSGKSLRSRIPYIDECCAMPMKIDSGAGAIMKSMCELAIEQGPSLSESQANRFAMMLIDAVACAVERLPEEHSLPLHCASKAHIRVWNEARTYINLNLHDPELDTDQIARHCKVSKRYIQSVFSDFDTTVTTAIRETRLKKCRDDLRNPYLRTLQISQIANRWGFNDIPYFCRAYKNLFGISPGKDRKPEADA